MSAADPIASGWRADLRLRFAARDDSTYLAARQHSGPLVIQRPFYPEPKVCHAYVVHPPGGVVGGDELHIDVDVERSAHVLLTTPAAAKFYRSAGRAARQEQTIIVQDAAVEWLPQESIYFRESIVRSDTRIRLRGASRFIGWEIACLGLPARNEIFDAGSLRLGFELEIDGCIRTIDRLRIDGASSARTAHWGLADYTAIGTMFAYPADRSMIESVRELGISEAETGMSLVDDVLVCRALGVQAEPVRRALIRIWKVIRPALLRRAALLPRIWAT